jgi:hypothetical protein
VGITFRPDLYPGDVRSVDEFLKQVGREHPAVVEMVHSGKTLDTNVYRNYMYEASERYSGDGWFVLGDAADTVDPLYSSGLVTVALQSSQIAELVRRGLAGEDLSQLASLFDDAYACFHRVTTSEVTNLYPVMHDPYQCHLRQHLTVLAAFHLGVPMAANGYLACPDGARLFRLLAHPRAVAARMRGMHALIAEVAARTGPLTPETFVKVQSAASMNWQFMEYLRESDIPLSLASLLDQLLALRRELLRRLDVNVLARPRLSLETAADLAQSAALAAARGQNLRRWKPAGLLARSLERIAPPVRPEAALSGVAS